MVVPPKLRRTQEGRSANIRDKSAKHKSNNNDFWDDITKIGNEMNDDGVNGMWTSHDLS
nr:11814_t:CDS:2 [Entrophospora candida]